MKFHGSVAFLLFCLLAYSAHAQYTENQGWVFLTHTQKLDKKLDLLFDAQTRTANRYVYMNTLLLRGGLNYHLNDEQAFAFGFAYKADRDKTGDIFEYTNEQRIYEQYQLTFGIKRVEMMLRARLEQRWIRESSTNFSQRARIFISTQIPLFANEDFSKGIYTGIQNEIFLNVTNKRHTNEQVFDQNRAFASAGYRWSKSIDTELGYMFWYQPEKDNTFKRGVIQLQITTSF